MTYTFDPVFGPGPASPTAVIPVSTSGTPYGGPYTKAVTLVPGTPVAPGRGVIIKGSGTFGLKLKDGGTIAAGDPSAGGGYRLDGFAVIDADVSQAGANPVVQILY